MSDAYKKAAAQAALDEVRSGMTLGLGTGSTAAHFVDLLGDRVRDGLEVAGVPTSEETRARAQAAGVPLIEPDETTRLALAVDGADEIGPGLALIKGGGGALLREKIIAQAAERFVVVADASKRVAALGAFSLPVEIDRFAWALTVRAVRGALADCGFAAPELALRPAPDGGAFLSDGGHLILDCALDRIDDPAALEGALRAVPGVVETGLFVGLADVAIVAGPDGVAVLTP
ncbi:MAG: ribose-5-phosphate isomerase RpiA [Pseudomonadota bacterium]